MPTTIEDLSEDLLIEIISRLPVKPIMLCKCVCKPWSSLLSQKRFIKHHLNRSSRKNPNLILTTNLKSETLETEITLLTIPATTLHTLDSETPNRLINLKLNDFPAGVKVAGSCNGLLCLSDDKTFVCLLNPSTREHFILPFPPVNVDDVNSPPHLSIGFGCDPVSEAYKIVAIPFPRFDVMVYTLSTNSWSRPENAASVYCYIGNARPVHLNGVVHWDAIRMMGHESRHAYRAVICFNLMKEEFGELSRPSNFDERKLDGVNLGVWDGCLSMFHHLDAEHVDLWIMKDYGVKKSWTRILSVRLPPIPHVFPSQPLVFQKIDEIIIQLGNKIVSYDRVSQLATAKSICSAPDQFTTTMTAYVEALTSIVSLMVRDNVRGWK